VRERLSIGALQLAERFDDKALLERRDNGFDQRGFEQAGALPVVHQDFAEAPVSGALGW
jgi:hypothetical protein